MRRDADEVHHAEIAPLPAGDYRLRVDAVGDSAGLADPVHGLVCVIDDAEPDVDPSIDRVTTYALLVGIDAYEPPVNPLFGCRNDIAALGAYLEGRSDGNLDVQHVARRRGDEGRRGRRVPCPPRPGGGGRCRPVRLRRSRQRGTGATGDRPPRADGTDPDADVPRLQPPRGRAAAARPGRQGAQPAARRGRGQRPARRRHPRLLPLRRRHPRPVRPDTGLDARRRQRRAGLARPRRGGRHAAALDGVRARRAGRSWSAPRPPHVALAACRSYETAKEHRVGEATRGCVLRGPRRCPRRARHAHRRTARC